MIILVMDLNFVCVLGDCNLFLFQSHWSSPDEYRQKGGINNHEMA